jgi:CHRD domain
MGGFAMRRHFINACLADGLFSSAAGAATLQYHAVLRGSSEVPPTTTNGIGELYATLDSATKQLTYTLSFSGLTGPAGAAHFHGPALAGVNADVVVPITGNLAEPVHATPTPTEAQMKDLAAGKLYVNVHTAANKGGEIRGQLMQLR